MLSAGLLDQTIGTALLLLMIFAITDQRNQPLADGLGPILVGLVVVAIGMSFGGMHGYAINPARDFGPRLFTVLAGFHNNGLTDGSFVWWVPIVGPLVGGVIGGAVYDFGIRRFCRVVGSGRRVGDHPPAIGPRCGPVPQHRADRQRLGR